MSGLPHLRGRPAETTDRARFLSLYGRLFEHSPWVVERAWGERPFADAEDLHTALTRVVASAGREEKLALLRAHPKLADKAAIAEGLTDASAAEQASAGLDRLTPAELEAFHDLNQAYQDRFGFPFIICVRLHDKAGVLAAMRARLARHPAQELAEALVQVGLIVRLRLGDVSLEEAVQP
jgi:2-oxo-4-hydroxy-4-carboxy-5-ureidoimidazoline decarboxylase